MFPTDPIVTSLQSISHGSLALGIAKINDGTSFDEEIHNDDFLESTGREQVRATILLQADSVLDVELHHSYEFVLIANLLRNMSVRPHIQSIHVFEDLHAAVMYKLDVLLLWTQSVIDARNSQIFLFQDDKIDFCKFPFREKSIFAILGAFSHNRL